MRMRNSNEIKQQLSGRMDAFKAESDAQKRAELNAEVRALTAELNDALALETAQRAMAANKQPSRSELNEIKRYSISKAIREAASGRLSGLEAEMDQEARSEMRAGGRKMRGVGIPSIALRTIDVQNVSTATEGAEFKTTSEGGYFDALKNAMLGSKLGVQYLGGLNGDKHFVKGGDFVAEWIAEGDPATMQKAAFSSMTMTPHRLQALAGYTYDILEDSSYAVDQMILNSLIDAHAHELDAAIFGGSGLLGEPTGIMAATGVNACALSATPTYAELYGMKTAIAAANGVTGPLNFVTNGTVEGLLATTPIVAGYPQFLLGPDGRAAGAPVHVSNAIASGTILLGDFRNVMVGQWGALDMIVDPYTSKDKGIVEVTVVAYHDIGVKHGEAFAVGTITAPAQL